MLYRIAYTIDPEQVTSEPGDSGDHAYHEAIVEAPRHRKGRLPEALAKHALGYAYAQWGDKINHGIPVHVEIAEFWPCRLGYQTPGNPYPTAVIITDFTIHNIGFEEKK